MVGKSTWGTELKGYNISKVESHCVENWNFSQVVISK